MIWRIALTLVSWFVSSAFGMVLDGRPFHGALWLIGGAVIPIVAWLTFRAEKRTRARLLMGTMVLLNGAVVAFMLIGLPRAYRLEQELAVQLRGESAR